MKIFSTFLSFYLVVCKKSCTFALDLTINIINQLKHLTTMAKIEIPNGKKSMKLSEFTFRNDTYKIGDIVYFFPADVYGRYSLRLDEPLSGNIIGIKAQKDAYDRTEIVVQVSYNDGTKYHLHLLYELEDDVTPIYESNIFKDKAAIYNIAIGEVEKDISNLESLICTYQQSVSEMKEKIKEYTNIINN